jgi:hypothetical protein
MQPPLPNHRGHDVHSIEYDGDRRCPRRHEPASIEKKDYAEEKHEEHRKDRRKDRGPIVRLNVPRKPLSPDERLQGEMLHLQRQHRACRAPRYCRPFMMTARQPRRCSAASWTTGSIRHISRALPTLVHIFPLTRNVLPPNVISRCLPLMVTYQPAQRVQMSALADPTRRAILERHTSTSLGWPAPPSRPAGSSESSAVSGVSAAGSRHLTLIARWVPSQLRP